MARREVTGRKQPDAEAFTVPEFCEAHRISEGFYYKLKRLGLGPIETKLLSKVIITKENAEAWRRQQGADAAAEALAT
jgi:hypothetical protein